MQGIPFFVGHRVDGLRGLMERYKRLFPGLCNVFGMREIGEFFRPPITFLQESLQQSSNISCGWVTYIIQITAHTNWKILSQTRAT